MKISKLHQYDVITLIPIYREEEHDLKNTMASFVHDAKTLKFFVVMIVDGYHETIDVLHKILNIDSHLVYEQNDNYKYLFHQNEHYDFLIIAKDENKGKFDSQLLFLSILNNSVDNRSFVLDQLKLSVLMLDSDTEFMPNSVNILHTTLWQQKDAEIAAVTGIVYARTRWWNILECSQYQKYLMSHLIRKNFESAIKSVICLQGNYSLFKLSVLLNEEVRHNFSAPQKSILGLHDSLGEDRFLSSIILKKGYKTLYTPQSTAQTTVSATLVNYLLQRKRWNNSILSSYLSFLCENKNRVSWHIKSYLGLDLVMKFLMPAILYQYYHQFAFVSEDNYLLHQLKISHIGYFITALVLLIVLGCRYDVRHYSRMWVCLCTIITFAYSTLIFQVLSNLMGVVQGNINIFKINKYFLRLLFLPLYAQ